MVFKLTNEIITPIKINNGYKLVNSLEYTKCTVLRTINVLNLLNIETSRK